MRRSVICKQVSGLKRLVETHRKWILSMEMKLGGQKTRVVGMAGRGRDVGRSKAA